MSQYDFIVVGSGMAGLTAARILSMQGKRILLVEQAPSLGGSAKRFNLGGIPFDVGCHFTGGFAPDGSGVLQEMLEVLGAGQRIQPEPYTHETCHRMVFPSLGLTYLVPAGIEALCDRLQRDFPALRDGIAQYFQRYRHVIANTPTLSLSGFDKLPPPIAEDFISLQAVLDQCVPDPLAQAVLSGFCLCYGSRPLDVSFATHARVSAALHDSLSRIRGGGQALVDALVDALLGGNVDVRTDVGLAACTDVRDRRAGRFVLTDGTSVHAGACILAIHPHLIERLLPQEHMSKAFRERVRDFEPSIGFFALFGRLRGDAGAGEDGAPITTTYPALDLNQMLDCHTPEPVDGPMVVLRSREQSGGPSGGGGEVEAVSALEVAFPQWTAAWSDSVVGRRPPEYYRFKEARVAAMLRRMGPCLPDAADRLEVLGSASTLTFRDYLHSPDGSAYGIRQKMGQINVLGRLPLVNCYAIGQSALLPGVIGAMTSAFLVCRGILGIDDFRRFLASTPCR
jgi:all-trans-retinol 13,14-reductase